MGNLLLGVDGGGSKTSVLLADLDGMIIGRGVAGSSNYRSVGFECATQALRNAIEEALQNANLGEHGKVAAACLGLAGAGDVAAQNLFRGWLKEQDIAVNASIVTDADLVLAAGTTEGYGIALICGTGSICYGRTKDGRIYRAGGWGHLLGDEGSAYDIAIRMVRLATQTADRRADSPTILEAVLDFWGLKHPAQLIDYVYGMYIPRSDFAKLAQQVVALARSGDLAATRLLTDAAQDLSRLISTVVRELKLEEPEVAVAGGLILSSESLRKAVAEQSQIEYSRINMVEEPAIGALLLASYLLVDSSQSHSKID